ncbi:MAG: phosphate ABC transporter permease PstA [Gammaproteobacteria bacterium]|nr:phosphate ABC transporter permease PstA [Gammaproteobacteria bacterium]
MARGRRTHTTVRAWLGSGSPWVWLTAGAVSVNMVMVTGVIGLIGVRGLEHFWPARVEQFSYVEPGSDPAVYLGERVEAESVYRNRVAAGFDLPAAAERIDRYLYKIGNRDVTGLDFKWFVAPAMGAIERPASATVIEREEWGNLYAYPEAILQGDNEVAAGDALWRTLEERLARAASLRERIEEIEKDEIGAVNYAMERLRLEERDLAIHSGADPGARARIDAERARLQDGYERMSTELRALHAEIDRDSLRVRLADGRRIEVRLAKVLRVYRPNAMGLFARFALYASKLREFVFEDPREANTEGGIFPAIFGTVLMVLLMSVFTTPFGVVAAVYLHEYARQGTVTRIIRIAVNNLAGVPSVVYGVFGLGFFVYFLGSNIDRVFFAQALPAPTFGTPGLLWSSLTLAILTVPVVIVATEEGLSRIPRSIREGSLALGATRAETLWRTVLPMATPAMMTGLILAIARAAGEVAPLMLVGVVKLAPTLPLDGNFPYLHLERKFMHLGFHIYDVGFQSPNVEAARPLVYSTSLLLVVIVVALNLAAIQIRNRLREKYNAADS